MLVFYEIVYQYIFVLIETVTHKTLWRQLLLESPLLIRLGQAIQCLVGTGNDKKGFVFLDSLLEIRLGK